jgi:hypothetical protein
LTTRAYIRDVTLDLLVLRNVLIVWVYQFFHLNAVEAVEPPIESDSV